MPQTTTPKNAKDVWNSFKTLVTNPKDILKNTTALVNTTAQAITSNGSARHFDSVPEKPNKGLLIGAGAFFVAGVGITVGGSIGGGPAGAIVGTTVLLGTAATFTAYSNQASNYREYGTKHGDTNQKEDVQYQKELNKTIDSIAKKTMKALEDKGANLNSATPNFAEKKNEIKGLIQEQLKNYIHDKVHGKAEIRDVNKKTENIKFFSSEMEHLMANQISEAVVSKHKDLPLRSAIVKALNSDKIPNPPRLQAEKERVDTVAPAPEAPSANVSVNNAVAHGNSLLEQLRDELKQQHDRQSQKDGTGMAAYSPMPSPRNSGEVAKDKGRRELPVKEVSPDEKVRGELADLIKVAKLARTENVPTVSPVKAATVALDARDRDQSFAGRENKRQKTESVLDKATDAVKGAAHKVAHTFSGREEAKATKQHASGFKQM